MKRLCLLVSLLSAAALSASGQNPEKIYATDGSIYEGYICEQVPGEYVCVKTENTTHRIDWDKVEKTEKLTRNQDFSHGVLDIMVLNTGRYYKGHIVGTVLGKNYKIELTDSSTVVVDYGNVFCISSEIADPNESIWSQVEYLDRIDLRSGEIIEGFIVSRLMGKSLIIKSKADMSERTVPTGEIIKYVKIANPDYVRPAEEQDTKENKSENESGEELKEAKDSTFAANLAQIKLNGQSFKPAGLVEEADGMLVLKDMNVMTVSGEEIVLSVPVGETSVNPEVIRLKSERIYHKDKTMYPYYREDDISGACDISSVTFNSEKAELVLPYLAPGFYIVLPFIEGCQAAIFEVVK